MWDSMWLFECPHIAWWVGSKTIPSKHKSKSYSSCKAWLEATHWHIHQNRLVKGVISPVQIQGKGKWTPPFNGRSGKESPAMLNPPQSTLWPRNDLHSSYMQSTLTLSPPQNFIPLWHQIQAWSPGSCHLTQFQKAVGQDSWNY